MTASRRVEKGTGLKYSFRGRVMSPAAMICHQKDVQRLRRAGAIFAWAPSADALG
jgi:hypothetical protein